MSSKVMPFSWYGGKYSSLDFVLPQLPQTKQYIEPYGGSATVLINRDPSPVETFNDLDGDVVNFFEVLRDDSEQLLQKIALTPYSRGEYEAAAVGDIDGVSDVERARQFFVSAQQARDGLGQRERSSSWGYSVGTSRRDRSQKVSAWDYRIRQLYGIADRLRRVQIENKDALDIIQRYDSEDALIYCDPPYTRSARETYGEYENEMSDSEHRELAVVLRSSDGKVAISGYQCELYEELFEDHGWYRVDGEPQSLHGGRGKRVESLWLNYESPHRDVDVGIESGFPDTVEVSVDHTVEFS